MRARTRDSASAGRGSPDLIPISFDLPSASIERRAHTFLGSLVLHLALVGVLTAIGPQRPPLVIEIPTEEDLLAEEPYRLTWYIPKQELPRVAPLNTPAKDAGADRALQRFQGQTIVANDPNPDSDRQMILGPAPEIKIEQDLPLPNLIAWNTPEIARPRFQLERQEESAPQRQALAAGAAPKLAVPAERLDLESLRKRDPLRYMARETEQQAPTRQAVDTEAAPELPTRAETADLAALQDDPKLRYWTEPTALDAPEVKAVDAPTAPVVDTPRNSELDLGRFQVAPLLRYQTAAQEIAPPTRAALTPSGQAPSVLGKAGGAEAGELLASLNKLDLPPGIGSPDGRDGGRLRAPGRPADGSIGSASGAEGGTAGEGEPGAVVVGLDPHPDSGAAIPIGSRRGRFSASPDGGPGAGQLGGGPVNTAALRVPNLSISGGDGTAGSGLAVVRGRSPSERSRPAGQSLRDELRTLIMSRNARDLGGPPLLRPEPADVPPPDDPDILFMDRDVFALAINMPNITSQAGSWIIRFAERVKDEKKDKHPPEQEPPPKEPLSAPAARLKVDPKYIRSAVNEHIEGTVTLFAVIDTEGQVDAVRVMKGLDERLDQSAVAALSQWKFHPATRSGVPVEVDAVIEVPFRLLSPERWIRRY